MDYNLNKNDYNLVKRSLKFIFSLIPLVLCYSSGFFSLFLHSCNLYFSNTFFFSFVTHTIDRKYMFLICNGILAFLVKSLTSSTSSSSSPLQSNMNITEEEIKPSVHFVSKHDQHFIVVEAIDGPSENVAGNVIYIADQEEQEREEKAVEDEDEEHAEEKEDDDEGLRVDLAGEDDHGEREEVRSGILVKQEEEDAKTKFAEDIGSNDDDLNRKIEEFIRKMKEEIRIEARQQLIAV